MRKLRYTGTADMVDMRPVVGKDSEKFVFYSRRSKRNPKEGERQHLEGVEVSNDDALAILTSPHRVWGFEDITDAANPVVEGQGPEPQGTPETGYPVEPLVPAEEPKGGKAKATKAGDAA